MIFESRVLFYGEYLQGRIHSTSHRLIRDGECVGYITSGSYAYTVGRSMALGYVATGLAKADSIFEVEINGETYVAQVVDKPLYDPGGERMRG